MPTKPSFTVCCICRDMAAGLPRMMASLAEFRARGGRVIICDTGSKDDSAAVARSLGADVTEVGDRFMITIGEDLARQINERFVVGDEPPLVQPGSQLFHFANARNFVASLADTDWVSWLDADEAFTVLDLDKIEEIIADPDLEHMEYDFCFAHAAEDGVTPAIMLLQSKMYRRSRIRWAGAVHEVIRRHSGESVREGAVLRRKFDRSVFYLEHWQLPSEHRANYLPGLAYDCFMKLAESDIGVDRNLHYLGRECVWAGRPRTAIRILEEHVAMNRWPAERAQSWIFMGDSFGAIQAEDRQIQCYLKAYDVDASRRVALLRLAHYYKGKSNWQAASAFAAASLEVKWHGGFYADDKAEYGHVPHVILYQCAGWMSDIPKAQWHLKTALAFAPWHPECIRDAKLYWGYDLEAAPEGWMAPLELLWLGDMARGKQKICEVGSWKGRSTHALCSGAAATGGEVWAIDHWRGSVGEDEAHAEAKADPEAVYQQFIENTKQFSNLHVHRADSLEAAWSYEHSSFDMIFVDGSHDYKSVLSDLMAWGPKVKPGGILCGHDFGSWPEVTAAVREYLSGEPDGVVGSIWFKRM